MGFRYRTALVILPARKNAGGKREFSEKRIGVMPKQKTKKSAAKRFKVTASGKVKYSKAGSGHLLSSKSRKRKRTLRKSGILSDMEARRVTEMMGN